ncbi:hypothetical protein CLF_102218 [Clonorchis sinensis]|uniref:Uncharacterized protein n=1 Tax=Clonorchis sinensis TaxID=79923 RepID=G7Y7I5_CLOSI|nr:hypothetical protein CLF_102218 [Clonorchis sinensis]
MASPEALYSCLILIGNHHQRTYPDSGTRDPRTGGLSTKPFGHERQSLDNLTVSQPSWFLRLARQLRFYSMRSINQAIWRIIKCAISSTAASLAFRVHAAFDYADVSTDHYDHFDATDANRRTIYSKRMRGSLPDLFNTGTGHGVREGQETVLVRPINTDQPGMKDSEYRTDTSLYSAVGHVGTQTVTPRPEYDCVSYPCEKAFFSTDKKLIVDNSEVKFLLKFVKPPHVPVATIFEISRYMYRRNALLIRLLKILRQPTTGLAWKHHKREIKLRSRPHVTHLHSGYFVRLLRGASLRTTADFGFNYLLHRIQKVRQHSGISSFRCLDNMPPEGSPRAEKPPGCQNMERGGRYTVFRFDPRTFRSTRPHRNQCPISVGDRFSGKQPLKHSIHRKNLYDAKHCDISMSVKRFYRVSQVLRITRLSWIETSSKLQNLLVLSSNYI